MKFSKILFYLFPLMGFGFYCFTFYPGYMSFDSATQYKQVVSGDWTTISPVIMVFIWTILNEVIAGPGGLFIFFQIIFWLGLFLFIGSLHVNYWLKLLLIIVISFWPFNVMILPHLWKDVGLISFLMLSLGLIQLYKNIHKTYLLYLALFFLVLASLFRFESILYLSIVIVYFSILLLRHYQIKEKFFNVMILSAVILCINLVTSKALTHYSDSRKVTVWPAIVLWDIASVSIKVNKVLLPEFTTGPGMTVEDLSNAVVPWANITLFTDTKAGINAGIISPYSDQQYKELLKQWINMMIDYPQEYLEHRIQVTKELLRYNETENKSMNIFFTRQMAMNEAKFSLNDSVSNLKFTKWINSNIDHSVFKGWLYFLISLILLIYIVLSRSIRKYELSFVLLISGFCSVIVLFLSAPSAEQRYLIWLINSLFLSTGLMISKKFKKQ